MIASSAASRIALRNPILLALDVDDEIQALKIAREVGPLVGALKVGPRLIVRYGAPLVQKLAQIAPVFLDHKFFDIPSTMVGAIQAAFDAGASFATIHAACGAEALTALAKLETELNGTRPFQILCVTILTSFDQAGLPPLQRDFPLVRHVEELTKLVAASGLSGIVCSPHEITLVKKHYPSAFIVTPGIRPADLQATPDDQKRTLTPSQALEAGASALVIGRPILQAQNPRLFIEEILRNLA